MAWSKGKKRTDVDSKVVRKRLAAGEKVKDLAKEYKCSEAFIRLIKRGKRKRIHRIRPIDYNDKNYEERIKEKCTCCKKRDKGSNKRFLCDYCFENASDTISLEHFATIDKQYLL